MAAKRLTLSLGANNEENMQCYNARDSLGFTYNCRILTWLLEAGDLRNASGQALLPAMVE